MHNPALTPCQGKSVRDTIAFASHSQVGSPGLGTQGKIGCKQAGLEPRRVHGNTGRGKVWPPKIPHPQVDNACLELGSHTRRTDLPFGFSGHRCSGDGAAV